MPTVISYLGQGQNNFQKGFSYEGTMDYSSYLSFTAAIYFRDTLMGGGQRIMDYIHNLAVAGGELLVKKWGTEMLVPTTMIGAMVNVRLPTDSAERAQALPDELIAHYNTFVPVTNVQGRWYVRVSAQIYNDISDFNMLGDAVLKLLGPTIN